MTLQKPGAAGAPKITPSKFVLVLASSASGKTIAARALFTKGYPALDVDDARTAATDPFLKGARRSKLWSIHNTLWHGQVWGAVSAIRRQVPTVPLVVFDHTGWFVEDFASWSEVLSVVVVMPAPVNVRVQRFIARGKKLPDFKGADEVKEMLESQDKARRGLIARVDRHLVRHVSETELWSKPECVLPSNYRSPNDA